MTSAPSAPLRTNMPSLRKMSASPPMPAMITESSVTIHIATRTTAA